MSTQRAVPSPSPSVPYADHMASLWTAEQAAEYLSVPVSWVYAEARAGRLPSLQLGRYRRFRPAVVEAWLLDLEGRR